MQWRSRVDRPLAYLDALVVVAILAATVHAIQRSRDAFVDALRAYGRVVDFVGIEPAVAWLYITPIVVLFTLSSLAMWRRWPRRWLLQAGAVVSLAIPLLLASFRW